MTDKKEKEKLDEEKTTKEKKKKKDEEKRSSFGYSKSQFTVAVYENHGESKRCEGSGR